MVPVFSKLNLKTFLKDPKVYYLGFLSILSVFTYILVSRMYFRIGFPLDDSWIHQTYARNLADFGEWAFLPGTISGGSTSPIWTALLSIGYLLRFPFYIWTFGLGIILLWTVAYFVEVSIRKRFDFYHPGLPLIGLIIIFEWHLAWAAASGMETLLFSALVLWVLFILLDEYPNYFKVGVLIGLSVWIRPDGITLLGPALMVSFFSRNIFKSKLTAISKIFMGFGVIFSLYLLFSLALTGTPWPTTFYAKQAEYEILTNVSILDRLGKLSLQLFVGIGSVLLPGFLSIIIKSIRRRKWGYLAGFFWAIGFLLIYAWRLPVVYQHGRYVFPVILVYVSFSCIGIVDFFNKQKKGVNWIIEKAWKISIGMILFLFWGYGAFIYAQDVAVIESEMVDSAIWVNTNIPENAIVAAHDIGALGYYGNHRIVDLAGLISPEVIPFMRDENKLVEFLDNQNVDYLISFKSWYPILSSGLLEIYSTQGRFAPMMGGENMVIFQWSK